MYNSFWELVAENIANYVGDILCHVILVEMLVNVVRTVRERHLYTESDMERFRRYGYIYCAVLMIVSCIILVLDYNTIGILAADMAGTFLYSSYVGKLEIKHALRIDLLMAIVLSVPYLLTYALDTRSADNMIVIACILFIEYMMVNLEIWRKYNFSKAELGIISANVIITVYIVYIISSLEDDMLRIAGIVCAIANCMLTLWLVKRIKTAQENEKEHIRIISEYKLQEKYIQSVKAMDERLHRIKHDMQKNINTMRILLNGSDGIQKTREYLEQYSSQTGIVNEVIRTENSVLNAIINDKLMQCQNHGIQVSVSADKKIDKLSDVELCCVLGNLIDNAIEAECKINREDRKINISICMNEDVLDIYVSNRIDAPVIDNNKELLTSKEDTESHGFGISNVRDVVSKHDGCMDIYEENNMFCIHITI